VIVYTTNTELFVAFAANITVTGDFSSINSQVRDIDVNRVITMVALYVYASPHSRHTYRLLFCIPTANLLACILSCRDKLILID